MLNSKHIAALQAEIAALKQTNKHLESMIAGIAYHLREQDQLIFNMTQQTSWEAMRPFFQKLCEAANVRMKDESNRIRDVLIPEIKKTYTEPKMIGKSE